MRTAPDRPADDPPATAMREVVKAMAQAADFAHLAEEWELLQQLYQRYPELFSRIRLDQVDRTMAVLAAEIADRIGPPASAGMYPAVLVGAAFAALQAAENRSRVDSRGLHLAAHRGLLATAWKQLRFDRVVTQLVLLAAAAVFDRNQREKSR